MFNNLDTINNAMTLVKANETIIAAVVGAFWGVFAKFIYDHFVLRHRLKKMIKEEIRILTHVLEELKQKLTLDKWGLRISATQSYFSVFDGNVNQLGLLNPNEVKEIITFYYETKRLYDKWLLLETERNKLFERYNMMFQTISGWYAQNTHEIANEWWKRLIGNGPKGSELFVRSITGAAYESIEKEWEIQKNIVTRLNNEYDEITKKAGLQQELGGKLKKSL